MMNRFLMVFLIVAGISVMQACKKKGCTDETSLSYDSDAEEDDGTCVYGGAGGNITIIAKPEHHGDPITGKAGYVDSAFVKFNAINSPGSNPSAYDLVVAGQVGDDHVDVAGLLPGKYYIFMTGFDSASAERVYGGIPVMIDQTSGSVEVVVPVSE